MTIGGLALLSIFGGIGAVYVYTGITGTRRVFAWCGIIMAGAPFLLSNVPLLCAVEIALTVLPYLLHHKNAKTEK